MINSHDVVPGLCSSLVSHIYSLSELFLHLVFPYPYISQSFANHDGFLGEEVYFIQIITDCILISISLLDVEMDYLLPRKLLTMCSLKSVCIAPPNSSRLSCRRFSFPRCCIKLFRGTILAANGKQQVSGFTAKLAASLLGKA